MKVQVPFRLLFIEGDGYHLSVQLRINGKSAHAIIDTGASKTVFDQERIVHFVKGEQLAENDRLSTGLGTTTMQSQVVHLKKLQIGRLVMKDYSSVVLNLSHVNKTYETLGLQPIDGVLGSDILVQYKAVIDYAKKTLTLQETKKKAVKKTVAKKAASKKKKAVKKPAAKKKGTKKTARKK